MPKGYRTRSVCSVEDCAGFVKRWGLCERHSRALRRTDPDEYERLRVEHAPREQLTTDDPSFQCTVDGCLRVRLRHEWCFKHYMRLRNNGSPTALKPKPPTLLCSIEGCNQKHRAYGWCAMHRNLWLAHGDPLAEPVRRPERGCLVDGCDERHEQLGYCHDHAYAFKRYGDALRSPSRELAQRKERGCTYDGCTQPWAGGEWCSVHGPDIWTARVTHA